MDLNQLKAQDIMTKIPITMHKSTTIPEAVKIMDECHLLNLPVERDGEVSYSIARHDLLRA
ncbi:MAG: hypothetical protein C4293_03940 [Nitrospiraceae bacterium]